jgi:DNA-binding winged helix-turn-helix (wHTH) protein
MRFRFADVVVDSEARTVLRASQPVALSGKAFQLLELLIASRPRALTKQEILDRIWPDTFVSESNLTTLIKEIRAAIGDDARQPRYIRTIHRHGYSFSADVAEEAPNERGVASVAVLTFENATGSVLPVLIALKTWLGDWPANCAEKAPLYATGVVSKAPPLTKPVTPNVASVPVPMSNRLTGPKALPLGAPFSACRTSPTPGRCAATGWSPGPC